MSCVYQRVFVFFGTCIENQKCNRLADEVGNGGKRSKIPWTPYSMNCDRIVWLVENWKAQTEWEHRTSLSLSLSYSFRTFQPATKIFDMINNMIHMGNQRYKFNFKYAMALVVFLCVFFFLLISSASIFVMHQYKSFFHHTLPKCYLWLSIMHLVFHACECMLFSLSPSVSKSGWPSEVLGYYGKEFLIMDIYSHL